MCSQGFEQAQDNFFLSELRYRVSEKLGPWLSHLEIKFFYSKCVENLSLVPILKPF